MKMLTKRMNEQDIYFEIKLTQYPGIDVAATSQPEPWDNRWQWRMEMGDNGTEAREVGGQS